METDNSRTENLLINRRHFLKAGGLSAAMLLAGRTSIVAGPFDANDLKNLVPVDKKLSQHWLNSLYARGMPMSASGSDLKYIGMPINGICTGQVYLGGDGRLWHWNLDGAKNSKTNNPKGVRYMEPTKAGSPQHQGFAVKVADREFALDANGFKDVKFTNQYPMATIDYSDPKCPLSIQLQAYTPFIPLNRDDSSFPVVVFRYQVTNQSKEVQDVQLAGWLENFSGKRVKGSSIATSRSEYKEFESLTSVECSSNFVTSDPRRPVDRGRIALGLLGAERPDIVDLARPAKGDKGLFKKGKHRAGDVSESDASEHSCVSLGKTFNLQAGESKVLSFAVSWHVPEVKHEKGFGMKNTLIGKNHYATQWSNASEAASAVASRESELYGKTNTWTDTWYDSTLPYWFLERTFVTLNCVQTQMGQRLVENDGKDFYNFDEGVKCCPGNCTHVWHYAQGLARIFPTVEREARDRVDFGKGFDAKIGTIRHRFIPGSKFGDAIDGNCGTILRVLRESQMTTDYSYLASMWDRVKLAMDHVIQKWDADEDGMLAGAQHNTLDEPWFGQVHWLINLYHATLKATAKMARQMNEPKLAERYEAIVERGMPAMIGLLWNEDFGYFIHKPGDSDNEKHGSTNGCHIDQILGDSWLRNVGIDPILPKEKIVKTLEALWKYNFTPDVGAYRKVITNGRWYATEGDAGLVMCSFPNGKIVPKSGKESYAGYLNECMTGFEWQVAAHMIWEGMVEKGLAIGKAIYDRYQPSSRNPYNEIECSDHYSRAMASYGAFMAACGYQYDGPEGKLAFGPRIQPEDFRAAFTTANGWGSFFQKVVNGTLQVGLELRYGDLALKEFAIDALPGLSVSSASLEVDGVALSTSFEGESGRYFLRFSDPLELKAGQSLKCVLMS